MVQVYQTQQQIERLEKQHAMHERENSAAASTQQEQSFADAQSHSSNRTAVQNGSEDPQADPAERVRMSSCTCQCSLSALLQMRSISILGAISLIF